MENLDFFCIECGQRMPKDENILRKALGVLKEDGVYAMFLWLETKDNEIKKELIPLLNKPSIKKHLLNDPDKFPDDFKGLTEKLRDIAQDIDKLLFLKKILERTLIYALYHSKINKV